MLNMCQQLHKPALPCGHMLPAASVGQMLLGEVLGDVSLKERQEAMLRSWARLHARGYLQTPV